MILPEITAENMIKKINKNNNKELEKILNVINDTADRGYNHVSVGIMKKETIEELRNRLFVVTSLPAIAMQKDNVAYTISWITVDDL